MAGAGERRGGEDAAGPGAPDAATATPGAGAGASAAAAETVDWQAQAQDNYDRFLRARADYENLSRRMEREIRRLVRLGKRDILMRLLELADNMDRAVVSWRRTLSGAQGLDADSLIDGVVIIARQLQSILSAEGVEAMEAVGKAFDPAVHEAVAVWESDEVDADTVTDEIRRGYTHEGEVLRPAQVRVAKRPS